MYCYINSSHLGFGPRKAQTTSKTRICDVTLKDYRCPICPEIEQIRPNLVGDDMEFQTIISKNWEKSDVKSLLSLK